MQILNFRDIAKGDGDGSIVTITSLDGVMNGLVETKDRVLMGRDGEQTCTQTVAGMLRKSDSERKEKETNPQITDDTGNDIAVGGIADVTVEIGQCVRNLVEGDSHHGRIVRNATNDRQSWHEESRMIIKERREQKEG